MWSIFRYCSLETVDENELVRCIHGQETTYHKDCRCLLILQFFNERSSMITFHNYFYFAFIQSPIFSFLNKKHSLKRISFIF